MNSHYVKIKRLLRNDVLTIHRSNIKRLVTVNGLTYIQLGNMDNIQGILCD